MYQMVMFKTLIAQDPNIVNEAKQELINRINAYGALNRSNVNDELNSMEPDDRADAVTNRNNFRNKRCTRCKTKLFRLNAINLKSKSI